MKKGNIICLTGPGNIVEASGKVLEQVLCEEFGRAVAKVLNLEAAVVNPQFEIRCKTGRALEQVIYNACVKLLRVRCIWRSPSILNLVGTLWDRMAVAR